jgi:glycine dehydrogenase subunit 1
VTDVNEILLEHEILGGYDLTAEYPELKDHMLIAVTEMNTQEEIDGLVSALEEASHD